MKNMINTRADFDALPADEQAKFKQILAGSIYQVEKDEVNSTWKVVEDLRTIERFGFTLADFPDAVAPTPPVYIAPDPANVLRQQLAALDFAYPVTQRNLREITLALTQIIEAVTGLPAAANLGVQAVMAVEAQAQPLRDQLKAIEKGAV